ncbi:hypothetical protein [Streptomyces xantholiticus]|uniref:hypothetical protein n=1 Tax=Streptomyces xantholiticus TaxID=68285 RepID=UPI00167A3EA4|nr:hypothetical protein [Streptomyces xantholiticus]GGW41078.1 hypothetical protein GCM10010381_27380 [Streptomyces xantholiticus]
MNALDWLRDCWLSDDRQRFEAAAAAYRDAVIAEHRASFTMDDARGIARNHRAAVLRDGADAVDSGKTRFPEPVRSGAAWAARMLRRMADEAPREELAAVVARVGALPVPLGHAEPAESQDRRERYAKAVLSVKSLAGLFADVRAHVDPVMALADEEQAGLRARVAEAVAAVARLEQKRVELERIANAERSRVVELEAECAALQKDKEHVLAAAERRMARLEAAAGDKSTRTADEDPIAYSLTSAVEALHASSGAVIEVPSTTGPHAPGACDACGSRSEQWCPDCAACEQDCHGGHVDNPCTHVNAPWTETTEESAR